MNRWLHRFAVFTAVGTFLLVIAGGLVTGTGSGLAAPDWPLSYGKVMPPMTGGILYEHGHRMVATFVGLLTAVLAVWVWRRDHRPWVRMLAAVALGAVVLQGVVGGMTVLFLLPVPVSVAHAILAQAFFSLTVVLALTTSRSWNIPAREIPTNAGRIRGWAVLAASTVFLQLILGSIVRHTKAGLAIPDFPLSYGGILPPLGPDAMDTIAQYRSTLHLADVTMGQVWIHFFHRVGAIVTTIVVLGSGFLILRRVKREARLRRLAVVQAGLVGGQVLLGGLAIWTGIAVGITTAHVGVGALLLAATVVTAISSFRLTGMTGRSKREAKLEMEH
jgi:cytochrome c oxidase assembly protein subunit 15